MYDEFDELEDIEIGIIDNSSMDLILPETEEVDDTGNEPPEDDSDADKVELEKKLSTKERKELPDKAFGLPSQRKYPLYDKDMNPDAQHIHSAESYFKKCPDEDKTELANNILKACKKGKIKYNKNSDWYKHTSEYKKKKPAKKDLESMSPLERLRYMHTDMEADDDEDGEEDKDKDNNGMDDDLETPGTEDDTSTEDDTDEKDSDDDTGDDDSSSDDSNDDDTTDDDSSSDESDSDSDSGDDDSSSEEGGEEETEPEEDPENPTPLKSRSLARVNALNTHLKELYDSLVEKAAVDTDDSNYEDIMGFKSTIEQYIDVGVTLFSSWKTISARDFADRVEELRVLVDELVASINGLIE
jgi:hypothetical protein